MGRTWRGLPWWWPPLVAGALVDWDTSRRFFIGMGMGPADADSATRIVVGLAIFILVVSAMSLITTRWGPARRFFQNIWRYIAKHDARLQPGPTHIHVDPLPPPPPNPRPLSLRERVEKTIAFCEGEIGRWDNENPHQHSSGHFRASARSIDDVVQDLQEKNFSLSRTLDGNMAGRYPNPDRPQIENAVAVLRSIDWGDPAPGNPMAVKTVAGRRAMCDFVTELHTFAVHELLGKIPSVEEGGWAWTEWAERFAQVQQELLTLMKERACTPQDISVIEPLGPPRHVKGYSQGSVYDNRKDILLEWMGRLKELEKRFE